MRRIYAIILMALLLTACSTTRLIDDGEQLYTGIKEIEFVEAGKYADTTTGETAMGEVSGALDCTTTVPMAVRATSNCPV